MTPTSPAPLATASAAGGVEEGWATTPHADSVPRVQVVPGTQGGEGGGGDDEEMVGQRPGAELASTRCSRDPSRGHGWVEGEDTT